jgi:hypothetical protein
MSSSSLLVAIIRPVRCNSEFCSWLLWELEYSLLSTQRESRELHVATTRSTVKEAHCCDVEKANPADLRASLCRFLLHHDDVHVQASRSTNHQPIHVSVSNHATEPCTRPSRPSPYRTVQQPSVEGRGSSTPPKLCLQSLVPPAPESPWQPLQPLPSFTSAEGAGQIISGASVTRLDEEGASPNN